MRANVIQVAPRVSAPIVALPIKDNPFVEAGDLLFEIDPRTYRAALDQVKANLDQSRDRIKDLEAQVKSAEAALEQAESGIKQAEFAVTSAEATVVKTKADFERATRLVAKGDVSKRTYDEAVAANDLAQADLAKAQAQLLRQAGLQQTAGGIATAISGVPRSIADRAQPDGLDLAHRAPAAILILIVAAQVVDAHRALGKQIQGAQEDLQRALRRQRHGNAANTGTGDQAVPATAANARRLLAPERLDQGIRGRSMRDDAENDRTGDDHRQDQAVR